MDDFIGFILFVWTGLAAAAIAVGVPLLAIWGVVQIAS